MVIKSIKLINFRSHDSYLLECNKMTSLIVGENGCGKTSVLEALYIALQGKSFRAVDREIVQRGKDFYRIEVVLNSGEKTITTFDGAKKQFHIDNKKTARLPKKNKYPIVLFEPANLNLVASSPSRKRSYFDQIFSQLSENYHNSLLKYEKALKQRNELLKTDFLKAEELFSWNVLLAKYGFELNTYRKKFSKMIDERLTPIYKTIAENEDKISLKYLPQDDIIDESDFLKNLEQNFTRDHYTGHTNFGTHRDNYDFYFNNVPANGSASRGEIRSIILALKFIEAEIIKQITGCAPLILLDDVFSELDDTRQHCLVKNFKNNQVILTSVADITAPAAQLAVLSD